MKISNVQIQDLKELEEIIAIAEKAKASVLNKPRKTKKRLKNLADDTIYQSKHMISVINSLS
jgi:hypothetical protein